MHRATVIVLAFLLGVLASSIVFALTVRPRVVSDGPRCFDQLISAMLAHGGQEWDTEAAHLREMGAACETRYVRTTDYVGGNP